MRSDEKGGVAVHVELIVSIKPITTAVPSRFPLEILMDLNGAAALRFCPCNIRTRDFLRKCPLDWPILQPLVPLVRSAKQRAESALESWSMQGLDKENLCAP